jgi:hypothetical protein
MTSIYINSYQLGQRWGVAPQTLARWRCEGRGPKFFKVGGKILYRLADVEAFEAENVHSVTAKDDGKPLTREETRGAA